MICPKCGKENNDQARVCQKCGTNLQDVTEPSAQPVPDVLYAGFWDRVAAYLIDVGILTCISYVIIFVPTYEPFVTFIPLYTPDMEFTVTLISWIYFASFESSTRQATIGKLIVRITVIDVNGDRISFGTATIRYFSKILSGLILLIGFFMIALTKKKQGLHDLIAETLVIKKK